jgi:hypothetical protein
LANILRLQYHDGVAVAASVSEEGGDTGFELSLTKGFGDHD